MFKGKSEQIEQANAKKPLSQRTKFNVATIFTAVLIIAAVVVTNLLIGAVATRIDTKIDLTSDKILDFSDETKNVLKNLEQEVNIYSLIPEILPLAEGAHASIGEASDMVHQILEKYSQMSKFVNYKRIDTTKNPEFLQKYEGLAIDEFSIIFECGKNTKSVNINDIIGVNYSEAVGTVMTQSLTAEHKFTNAIVNVSNTNSIKVGVVSGHGETAFETIKANLLEPENYASVEVNLLNGDVPEDVNLLVIMSPVKDFSSEEIKVLDKYFDQGGNVQLLLDFTNEKTPVLDSYLKEWGITAYNGYVVEQDQSKVNGGTPVNIYPDINENPITNDLIEGNYRVLYPQARGMKIETTNHVEFHPLLTSSNDSYIKVDFESMEKSSNDIEGPAVVAAILARYGENGNPKFVVMGGTGIFAGTQYSAANMDFYYNSISYMTGNESSIYIRPKDISPNVLLLTQQQGLTIAAVTVVLIPVLILVAGFIIWIKRRHL